VLAVFDEEDPAFRHQPVGSSALTRPGVGLEVGEVGELHRRGVGGFEDHRGRDPGPKRFGPASRAQAPLISWLQTREVVLGSRGGQVVSDRTGEFQEIRCDPGAHDVHAGVRTPGAAAPVPVESGQRIVGAVLKLGTEDIPGHDL
jgi:hypothetical protein